jgi:hypothetical protein
VHPKLDRRAALVETTLMRTLPRRLLVVLAALLVTLTAMAAAPVAATAAGDTPARVAAPAIAWRLTMPEPEPTPTTNPFIPEDRNLSDCVSSVPQPGCGSKARSGWRQWLVFGVIALAIAFIGWRIVRLVRRNRQAVDAGEVEPSGRR